MSRLITMLEQSLGIKMLLIGDGGVGKSSFRRQWLGEGFNTQYLMTLGADFASKRISLEHSPTDTIYNIRFQIWDLAGQPRFKDVIDSFYRGSVGALCFFDVSNPASFTNLQNWVKSFWNLNGKGERPLIVVGAKSDLRSIISLENLVTPEQGETFAVELSETVQDEHGFTIHYLETSAKEDVNIDEAFITLASEIISCH